MASASGRKTTKGRTSTNTKRKTTTKARKRKGSTRKNVDVAVKSEAMLIAIFALAIFIFLCVVGVIQGAAAAAIKNFMFGVFGLMSYLIPVILFLGFAFEISNKGNTVAVIKLVSAIVLVVLLGITSYMLLGQEGMIAGQDWLKSLYETSSLHKAGGGVLFGCLAHLLYTLIGFGGTLFFTIVLGIICIIFITEKSFLSGVKKGGSYILESAREDLVRRREYWEEEDEEIAEQEEPFEPVEKVKRMDKKTKGVVPVSLTTLSNEKKKWNGKSDMHEIILPEQSLENAQKESVKISPIEQELPVFEQWEPKPTAKSFLEELEDSTDINSRETSLLQNDSLFGELPEPKMATQAEVFYAEGEKKEYTGTAKLEQGNTAEVKKFTKQDREEVRREAENIAQHVQNQEEVVRKYELPPLSLLKKAKINKGDSANQLRETAMHLQQTLLNFGVKVMITAISQGPSVTRYELQPEQGVKVSKIVGLSDDIKLNLAATDIRIEAPIPGKAAIGIEVPNKENSAVALRDLLETREFSSFSSNLAFAVGKDIGGKVVVTDIAKMPHLLIAGATGSGKSVCINTIIMSILYKANPNDVKMIMIDPKVVELSVYNGIPHLMIPVVTDPKKASAALHWGVAEMTDRYQKFADLNVRDLKGYNSAAEQGKTDAEGQPIQKMPQIVIIVDELADLMMVAAGEVEESICRLAQLARAAGIHLIIATQRPSVDVITGLIKANMPSRVAFSVSSGVDSRTILDMNGAEKLLGKGDMLFYPQGYAKPARIQGAFVSDSEVSDVVDFLKNQALGNTYNTAIEEKIKTTMSSGPQNAGNVSGSGVDDYFADAGRFVIEKDKASIGMLQRVFKIGFNRAARIVDQLESAGVVGEEEGTKPRKILMSLEQFETYLQDMVN